MVALDTAAAASFGAHPLHRQWLMRRTLLNRIFAAIYGCAIIALLYYHARILLFHCTTFISISISLSLLVADLVLAFMWLTTQSFRMRPIRRQEFLENLEKVLDKSHFPALDIFICTADPYKEPPIDVVNTALSVMAYDYPSEKISVYVSDDGGSELTLFAFKEAAKFACYWLPFCRENNIIDRCPEAFFTSNDISYPSIEKIRVMYEKMKSRVTTVVGRGKIVEEYIREDEQVVFQKWREFGFTKQNHPTVIKVLLESCKDRDISDHFMPNLIYVSREKNKACPHRFKAGALNVLIRVSATMTNAPVILTLDCDMYSNDPVTPQRALCYFFDNQISSKLGFVQFPQRFVGINQHDIYACDNKRLFVIYCVGLDGLQGTNHYGTCCFFLRRAFFGGPSSFVTPEIPALSPAHVVDNSIQSQPILDLAHSVASCTYETHTQWGFKMGFRYGSLVEDYYTGYRLHCEGWRSVFCHPKRDAFLGSIPNTLIDLINQNKRWSIGLLEVVFSKYNPLTFGSKVMGLLMGLGYSHYAFWPIWSIPVTIYAFLPQLALINRLSVFPKFSTTEPLFFLYLFLFTAAYVEELSEFILFGGTVRQWWNDQRMWMVRGVSSYLLGFFEYVLKSCGVSAIGFDITSKVLESESGERYRRGVFEFGVESGMFLPMAMAAELNLVSFVFGVSEVVRGNWEELVVQILIAGFVVVNCWPIYEAMVLRSDKGRMPSKITVISMALVGALCGAASHIMGAN